MKCNDSDTDHQSRTHTREKPQWAVTGLITLFCLGLLTVWLIPGNTAAAQNREPAPFPGITASSISDAATYRGIDAALRDRLGAQLPVARVVGHAAVDVLRRSPTAGVTLGPDGLPFLTEDMVRPCRESSESLSILKQQLASDAQAFADANKYVMYVVAPDKSSVRHKEVNQISPSLLRCSNFVRHQFERWDAEKSLPLITLWDDVAELDATPETAYERNDTHWNGNGATAMTRAVFAELIADGEAPPAILDDLNDPVQIGSKMIVGDLNGMMSVTHQDEWHQLMFPRNGIETSRETTAGPTGEPQLHFTSTSTDAPLIQGRTLFLGDSFLLNQVASQLPNFFEDVTIAFHSEYAQSGAFDRVIVERVQRYATSGDWPLLATTLN